VTAHPPLRHKRCGTHITSKEPAKLLDTLAFVCGGFALIRDLRYYFLNHGTGSSQLLFEPSRDTVFVSDSNIVPDVGSFFCARS
jgi:hypothetical protein